MAYYDEPISDPTLDFDTREQQLLQAAARIKALRGAAAAPIADPGTSPGWNSAVTGTHIGGQTLKTPIAALLSPTIAQVGADLGENRLNRSTSALKADQQADFENILKNIPQSKQVPLGPDEPTGSFVGDPSMAIAQMTDPVERARAQQAWANQQRGNMKTVEPTQAEVLGTVGAMQRNPLARALAAKTLESTLFTRPDKAEEREFQSGEKAKDRGATLAAAVAKARADAANQEAQRATTLEAARIRAGAVGQGSTGTFTLSPDGSTLYNTKDPTQRMPSGLEPKPAPVKPLPVEAGKAWRENNNSIAKIDQTLNALTAAPDATGLTKGAIAGIPGIGQNLVNKWDPGGVVARALVADIGSMVIHDRSGATVTAAETPRLRPFIPSATDSAVDAAKKLRLFKGEYQRMQQEIRDYAGSMGYKDPGEAAGGGGGVPPKQPASALPAPPKAGDVVDGYRFKGGNPNVNSNWEPAS